MPRAGLAAVLRTGAAGLLCGSLVAAAAGRPAPAASSTLTILHTSDLHGRVAPVDALAARDLGEGLARVAAAVRAIRAEGKPVLLLDSGDTIQGAPEQALAFSGASGPEAEDPIVGAMNLIGYDAMAVGNHDFDFGRRRLDASSRQARFPFLSANTLAEGGRAAFRPWVVREVAGVRVGILGLVTSQVAGLASGDVLSGLRFTNPVSVAKTWVPVLRDRERCDLVVVITHQGFEKDPETGAPRAGGGENRAYALATQVPGVDLVLTGHTHVVVAPRRLGAAWVSQPGRFGSTLTRFDLTFDRAGEGGRWKLAAVRGRNLPMRKVTPDPEVVARVGAGHDAAMRILAGNAADLQGPVSVRAARFEDTGAVDWVHAVQLRESKAELSFASVLGADARDWPAGALTVRQIWAFYPYENRLVTVRATGKQVREALERAARCAGDPQDRLRNCDSLEGADYAIDLTRPAGRRVVFLRRGGRDVADQDVFTVAISSFRASGGGGYGVWKRAEHRTETGNVRDMLIADARSRRSLRLTPTRNWTLTGKP